MGLGLCNGLITQFMGVPAFIATLGTGYVFYGVAQIVSQGSNINRLPKDFLAIGRTPMLGLPSAVFLALGVAVVFRVLISRTIFGRQLEAFGLGARAAALSGVPDIIDDELSDSLVSQKSPGCSTTSKRTSVCSKAPVDRRFSSSAAPCLPIS